MRFGAEELFKEEKNDEESKKRLLSMDIDEILERAEKVEEKEGGEQGNELLSAFKASNLSFLVSCFSLCHFFINIVLCKDGFLSCLFFLLLLLCW